MKLFDKQTQNKHKQTFERVGRSGAAGASLSEGTRFEASTPEAVAAFRGALIRAGHVATVRDSRGDDQMAGGRAAGRPRGRRGAAAAGAGAAGAAAPRGGPGGGRLSGMSPELFTTPAGLKLEKLFV